MTLILNTVDFAGQGRVVNLPVPQNPGDAVPKSYVDSNINSGTGFSYYRIVTEVAVVESRLLSTPYLEIDSNGLLDVNGLVTVGFD